MNLEIYNSKRQNLKDYLSHNFKIKQIQEYVRNRSNTSHNIISLYGISGSGKSSLLNTLFEELDKEYFTLKFNVWKYENETTLSLSLLYFILSRTESMFNKSTSDDLSKVLKIFGEYLLKNDSSDITSLIKKYNDSLFYIDYDYNKISINISDEHIRMIEFKENHVRKEEMIDNRFKLRELFEYLFAIYLNLITKRENNIIIIIDELEIYQSSKMFEFISNIRHLFTISPNICFIMGVNKESLTNIISDKFNNDNQAERYIDKLFSLTFNMPKTDSSKKLVKTFFGNNCDLISDFLDVIDFTNPRDLLKVIKRYYSLVEIKVNTTLPKEIRSLVPDIITNENSFKETKHKQLWNTIFVLYFIILHDFYSDEYDDFKNYNGRFTEYVNFLNKNNHINKNYNQLRIDNLYEKSFSDLFAFERKKQNNYNSLNYLTPNFNHSLTSKMSNDVKPIALMYLFMPRLEKIIDIQHPNYIQKRSKFDMNINPQDFNKISFEFDKNIQYRFTRFLLSNIGENALMKVDSEYQFALLIEMLEKLC